MIWANTLREGFRFLFPKPIPTETEAKHGTADPYWLNRTFTCPDCAGKMFILGPEGGCAVNIKCAGCGSKFNFCPPFEPQRIDNDDMFYRRPPVNLRDEFGDSITDGIPNALRHEAR